MSRVCCVVRRVLCVGRCVSPPCDAARHYTLPRCTRAGGTTRYAQLQTQRTEHRHCACGSGVVVGVSVGVVGNGEAPAQPQTQLQISGCCQSLHCEQRGNGHDLRRSHSLAPHHRVGIGIGGGGDGQRQCRRSAQTHHSSVDGPARAARDRERPSRLVVGFVVVVVIVVVERRTASEGEERGPETGQKAQTGMWQ